MYCIFTRDPQTPEQCGECESAKCFAWAGQQAEEVAGQRAEEGAGLSLEMVQMVAQITGRGSHNLGTIFILSPRI